MSEKKRSKKRKEEYTGPGEQKVEKPSKEEYKVAKWMKSNVKTKKTKFLNHNVQYFTSNKAIDALMKSPFVEGSKPLFGTRDQVVEFLDIMLDHKFFHRAKKVPVSMEELRNSGQMPASKSSTKKDDKSEKSTTKAAKATTSSSNKDDTTRKDTEAECDVTADDTQGGSNANQPGSSPGGEKKEKRKRKIRLDMHPEQIFVDGSEAYVWLYDPIPLRYWIYGLVLLLGAIGVCLFPLWPPMLRKGVYYLSVAAAGFLVFILALTVVRLIIFTIVWAVTGGKLHFWIFPNLTEDVGFFASFWPLYESKYVSDSSKSDKRSSKSKSKKKDKSSDAEDDVAPDAVPIETEKIENIKEHDADNELRHRNVSKKEAPATEEDSHSSAGEAAAEGSRTPSESESEISGKDYEIISTSEVSTM